jgi:hypothetical protein
MTTPEHPDKPPYDPVQLEAAQKARAKDFQRLIKTLSKLDVADEWTDDDEVQLGAHYDLSQSEQGVDVKYEEDPKGPNEITSKLRITEPWLEAIGVDGLRRRARLSQYVLYVVRHDIDIENAVDDNELPPPPEGLNEGLQNLLRNEQALQMEQKFSADYRPPELIQIRQEIDVEAKLPMSPNYRSERISSINDPLVQLSHYDIRRQIGEPTGLIPYSVERHDKIVALLKSIKSRRIKPQPLDSSFDEDFRIER